MFLKGFFLDDIKQFVGIGSSGLELTAKNEKIFDTVSYSDSHQLVIPFQYNKSQYSDR